MNEAQTRFNKIDPKLRDAGWGIVPGSKILVEQSAYIAPGRITTTGHKNPKKADYILEYKGMKLAVIEAKSDEKDECTAEPTLLCTRQDFSGECTAEPTLLCTFG